jgi:hypothetical protein
VDTPGPGADLLESLRILQLVTRDLKGEVERPAAHADAPLRKLTEAVDALGQTKAARPTLCPDEYVRRWEKTVSGDVETLDPRAIRYLCWHRDIATDQTFQYYLDRSKSALGSRSLQGLVSCCHSRWSGEFAAGPVAVRVLDRLKGYEGPNRLLQKWKAHANGTLGANAHEVFGREFVKQNGGIGQYCSSWGISGEASPFVQMAIEHAAKACLDEIDKVPRMRDLLFREILVWTGWIPDALKRVTGRLILESSGRDPKLIEATTRLVLSDRRFGDPRLRQNQNNWLGIEVAARRIKEWLSTADITFFFEHVLPKGKDPHGRKAFWLRFVGCRGLVSRPLLSEDDRYRLREVLREKREGVSHFGKIEGNTSAFLLDFGPVLVIEFSAVGNACYVYDKQVGATVVPDFWASKSFGVSSLKSPSTAIARVVHKKHRSSWQSEKWESEMEGILARYGVRAVS